MFLERIGKLCFGRVSPSLFYLLLLTPIFSSSLYLMVQNNEMTAREVQFANAWKKGRVALERKKQKETFLARYSHPDPYFLGRRIEALPLLQREQKMLENLYKHPALADKQRTKERLEFLKSDQNRLAFAEEAIRSTSRMKETEEKQRHPVEIDEEDLKQLLSLIEDIPIGPYSPPDNRPQILITDFRLDKKQSPFHTPVLQIDMKLLTREFSQ